MATYDCTPDDDVYMGGVEDDILRGGLGDDTEQPPAPVDLTNPEKRPRTGPRHQRRPQPHGCHRDASR